MKIAACVLAVFFVVATLPSASICIADNRMIDVVTMKDGTVIKGTILDLNTREVRIETLAGEEVVRPFEEVLTFQQELHDPDAGESRAIGTEEEPPPFFDRHTWEVGLEVYSTTYKEPGFMEQTGLMAGIQGAYAYHDGWMFRGELGFGRGDLDYTSSRTGSLSDIETSVLETRAVGGYDFMLSETSALTLYAGFGLRFLVNDSGGRQSTTGAYGYKRESTYFYSPIGIETVSKLSEKWRLSFLVEYDLFWAGQQVSYLSDVDPRYNDPSNDQNNGYGLRATVGAARDYGWGVLVIEPFVRYWDIGDSEVTTLTLSGSPAGLVYEPANKTTEVGLRGSLRF